MPGRIDDLDRCIIPALMGLSRDNSASSTTEIRDHGGVCPEQLRKRCHHGVHACNLVMMCSVGIGDQTVGRVQLCGETPRGC